MTLKSGTALIGVLSGQCLIFDAAADPPPPGYTPAPPSPSSHAPDLSTLLNKPNGPALRFKKEDFVPVPDMAPIQLDDPKIERKPPLKVTIPNIQEARQPQRVQEQPAPAQVQAAAPPPREGKGFFGRILSRLDSDENGTPQAAPAMHAQQAEALRQLYGNAQTPPAAAPATQMQKRGSFNHRANYTGAPMPGGTNLSVPYQSVAAQDLPPPPKPQPAAPLQTAQAQPEPLAQSPTPVVTRQVVHLTPDAVPPNRSIVPRVNPANRQNPFSELAPAAGEAATSPAASTAGAPLIALPDIPPEPVSAPKPPAPAPLPPIAPPQGGIQTTEPLIALPGMEAPKPKPPAAVAQATAPAAAPINVTPPPAQAAITPTPAATVPASVAQAAVPPAPPAQQTPAAPAPLSVAQKPPEPPKTEPDPAPAQAAAATPPPAPTPAAAPEVKTAEPRPAEAKPAETNPGQAQVAATPAPPPRALSSPLWEEPRTARAEPPATPPAKPEADTTALAQRPAPKPANPTTYGSSARPPQPTIASNPIGPARLPANVPSNAVQHWQGPDVIDARNSHRLPAEVLPPSTSTPVQQPLPWEEPAYAQAPPQPAQQPQPAPPTTQQAEAQQAFTPTPYLPARPPQPGPAQAKPIAVPALPVQQPPPAAPAPMETADKTEPQRMLSEESRQVVRNLKMDPPAARGSARPVLIERARDLSALDQKPQPASANGQVGHEALGVKIEIKPPRMNFDYELEKAYNALIAGQSNIAIEIYKRVLDNDANNKNALFGLATTYHRAGQIDLARPVYSRLLTVDPGNSDGLNNFLVLLSDEAPEEALGELMRLSERNPQYSALPAQIAVIYQKMGMFDKAAQYMFQAIGMAPENITYRYNFAIMLDKQGKYDEAVKLYRQLIQAYQRGEALPGSVQKIQQRLTFISSNRPS